MKGNAAAIAMSTNDSHEGLAPWTWQRRALMWPCLTLTAVMSLLLAPLWITLSLFLDLVRLSRLLSTTRGTLFFIAFVQFQFLGLLLGGCLFLAKCIIRPSAPTWQQWNRHLQDTWTKLLFRTVQTLFRVTFEVHQEAQDQTGPFMLFVRHVSVVDTLFPAVFVSIPWQTPLQYVLKSGLLWDPCLDLVGQRLPNCFVQRSSKHLKPETDRMGQLARALPPGEGIIIFPEGTRATQKKRQAMIKRAQENQNQEFLEQLSTFKHVLPFRRPGVLALLENTNCDVVYLAHTGFEGISTLRDIWNGSLIGRHIRAKVWRTNRTQWAGTPDEEWAFCVEQWKAVDAFIDQCNGSTESNT